MDIESLLTYIFDYASVTSLAVAVDSFRLALEAKPVNLGDEDREDISI
jgi:hypothetical protein